MDEIADGFMVHDLYYEQESQLNINKLKRNGKYFVATLNDVLAGLLRKVDDLIDVEYFGSDADIFRVRRELLTYKKKLYDLFLIYVPIEYSEVSYNNDPMTIGSIDEKVSHSASSKLSRFVDSVGLYLEVLAIARTEAQDAFNRAMEHRGLTEWENTKITHKRNEDNAKLLIALLESMYRFLPETINQDMIEFDINDWLKQDTLFINNYNKIQSTVMVRPPSRGRVIGFS